MSTRTPHLTAVDRQRESVTPLELFFDLVFVLALTQCTAYMADHLDWEGFVQALLILAALWWSWVGYSWLTSVVDPEEGFVRLWIFGAMAAFLVAALCIPAAFGDDAGIFAAAYGVVRFSQLALFRIAARDKPALKRSLAGLNIGTAIGVGLITAASFADGDLQMALWAAAIVLDVGEPYVFGSEGWQLSPAHFAERHALIVIIALGESIVAIGIGAGADVDLGIVVAAVLGVGVAAAQWWMYFDVVALVAERRLSNATPGKEQNEIARDSFSYLHFPMVAGIVLVALGMKKTLEHVEDPLKTIPAVALMCGAALYLVAHVAFRYRNVGRFSAHRFLCAAVLCALVPVAKEIDAVVSVGIVFALLTALIVYETLRFAELRERLRHEHA